MKKKLLTLCFIGALSVALITSCNKKDDGVTDTDAQEAGGDFAEADKSFSDAFDATYDATTSHPGLFKTDNAETMLLTECATVTVEDSLSATKKYLISFGNGTTDSCLGKDGRYRKGKLHVSITGGKFRTTGAIISVTTDGYYVNSNHIQGTKTIVNKGAIGTANIVYEITIKGEDGSSEYAVITRPNGKSHKWKATRTREVYFMTGTSIVDYCLHGGSGDGVTAGGATYTVKITNKLKTAPGCKWVESGSIEITPKGKLTRTIDFGTGACDRLATLTVNGKSFQFEMR
ncbi:MAG: hypothetical protein NTX03_14015 [Bacteroidetes bacterium]|nr:hypothetical protein [Bacteroidota bacterium]